MEKRFEIKDLGRLKYFLGIEAAWSNETIAISQQKYILDLLKKTELLGCRLANTPIEASHRFDGLECPPIEKEKY